ncbi:unnamed protein product [Fusarium venenatum]|uniref:Uncharacterized protein n=1 Tax=Fusarium venenatum TaxID=56646 RepID=A0A2L2T4Y0_9HYPO|nr:uncharacterized protein FVRRES_01181 [Fusarium venenatum]CEI64669.1 unnamed protein product [Fusarium venenatum]
MEQSISIAVANIHEYCTVIIKIAVGMKKWRNEYDLEQFKGAAFEERNYSPSFINPTKGTSKCQNPSPETNYQQAFPTELHVVPYTFRRIMQTYRVLQS